MFKCKLSKWAIAIVFCNLLYNAAGGTLKYSHGPLVSAFNSRTSREFVGGGSSGNGRNVNTVGSRVADSSGGDGGSGNHDVTIEGSTTEVVNGGEVLVPKSFPLGPQEPTCEQLRAMWIFSKRQSRAAEMTNEIPTYRDPFAYNVWEPYYPTTRSGGALRMGSRFGERSRSPVFGRIINREPLLPQNRMPYGQRGRYITGATPSGGPSRIYGTHNTSGTRGRTSQYRHLGSSDRQTNNIGAPNSVSAAQGSFQKLKELIWTERAKELTEQRRAEELAARAAVLKEIANGQTIQSSYKIPFKSESPLMDENRTPDHDDFQYVNDGPRMSIASSQLQQKQQKGKHQSLRGGGYSNNRKNPGQLVAFTRSGSNSNRSTRLNLPSLISSRYSSSREEIERSGDRNGIMKTYPIRPSHFRERNRSLSKQAPSSDYFQRDIRQYYPSRESENLEQELLLLSEILKTQQSPLIRFEDDDDISQLPNDIDQLRSADMYDYVENDAVTKKSSNYGNLYQFK